MFIVRTNNIAEDVYRLRDFHVLLNDLKFLLFDVNSAVANTKPQVHSKTNNLKIIPPKSFKLKNKDDQNIIKMKLAKITSFDLKLYHNGANPPNNIRAYQ
jgi:hypothetical protein